MRSIGWVAMAAVLVAVAPAAADVTAGSAAWARGDYRTAVEQWRGPANGGDAVAQKGRLRRDVHVMRQDFWLHARAARERQNSQA